MISLEMNTTSRSTANGAPAAPAAPDLNSKLINVFGTNWTVYGEGPTQMEAGAAFKQTFAKAGTFPYYCEFHGGAGGVGRGGAAAGHARACPMLFAASSTLG